MTDPKEKDTCNGANVIIWSPGDRILLVRHAYGSKSWALPGGAIKQGESPVKGAIRETQEETGLTPLPELRLFALMAQKSFQEGVLVHGLVSLYSTQKVSGEITEDPTGEIDKVQFMNLEEIFLGNLNVGLGYKRMIAIWRKNMHSSCVHEGALSEQMSIYLNNQVLWI